MKRRGFLGAVLVALVAPVAVAEPVPKKIQLCTTFGRFGSRAGKFPYKEKDFERDYTNVWAPEDQTDIASKINAISPEKKYGRGLTAPIFHIDEMAWFPVK